MNTRVPAALAVFAVTACSDSQDSPTGPRLEIQVAPLTLPGVADACYGLEVHNVGVANIAPSALVWSEPSICADRFGDGKGSITYIGTRDAETDGMTNTVSLVLNGLCKENGCVVSEDSDPETIPSDTYQNPCPSNAPCRLERPCTENADTLVEFNLTIMRDANQGFFDVAVNFEDIFCSAKLDCVDELLHRPGPNGKRDLTAVLGFACTSGAAETCLYASNVTLDCGGDNVWTIDPSEGPGKATVDGPADGPLYGAAVYAGDEAFTTFQKSYWNIALGLDDNEFENFQNCTLSWTTTASEEALAGSGPFTTPADSTYPFIKWERDIIKNGVRACGAHALNVTLPGEEAAGPSVATDYTSVTTPESFSFSSCDATPPQPSVTCLPLGAPVDHTLACCEGLTPGDGTCACNAGTANCDGDPINGCEVDELNDTNNCGGCGNGCAAGNSCTNGVCVAPGYCEIRRGPRRVRYPNGAINPQNPCQACVAPDAGAPPPTTWGNAADGTSCNDGNACTTDACSAGVCTGTPVANGTSCNDGNLCTQTDACAAGVCGGAPWTCSSDTKRVFVTSQLYTGNLGGVAGADAKCQALADGQSLGGAWKAWLGDEANVLSARFTRAPRYTLLDGTVIAQGWDELTLGAGILAAINMTETGGAAPDGTPGCDTPKTVWSNVNHFGIQSDGHCNGWTSDTPQTPAGGAYGGCHGLTTNTNYLWATGCCGPCNYLSALYCFEQ